VLLGGGAAAAAGGGGGSLFPPGSRVVLLVNNLGATPPLELALVAREALAAAAEHQASVYVRGGGGRYKQLVSSSWVPGEAGVRRL
jgi:hypothetical protein